MPFAPGGSSEIVARTLAVALSKGLGQSVFVDPAHDFKPVTQLAKVPSLYLVHPDVPAKNLEEFVALAKSKPGRLNYGSAGNGSAWHRAAVDRPVGRSPSMPLRSARPPCCTSSRRASCAASPPAGERLPQLPDVQSVAEQGYPNFERTQWDGLLAPASLPSAAVERLAAEAGKAIRTPAAVTRLAEDTAQAIGDSPAESARFIAAEQARWKPVSARAKIKTD